MVVKTHSLFKENTPVIFRCFSSISLNSILTREHTYFISRNKTNTISRKGTLLTQSIYLKVKVSAYAITFTELLKILLYMLDALIILASINLQKWNSQITRLYDLINRKFPNTTCNCACGKTIVCQLLFFSLPPSFLRLFNVFC